MQFFFAADRGSTRVANRYDALSPVFLRLLANVARHCRSAGVPLSLCGEMAAEPLEAMALIGIGYRSLSLPPFAVGPVKTMIRSVRLSTLEDYITVLSASAESSVRGKLRTFARDHDVIL
jgi:phosphotransferase system enzyme I (PtsP)